MKHRIFAVLLSAVLILGMARTAVFAADVESEVFGSEAAATETESADPESAVTDSETVGPESSVPESVSAERESAAPESEAAEPENTSAEPESTPAEPESAPAEAESVPAEPESTPAEPESTPAESENTPAESETAVSEGASAEPESAVSESEQQPEETLLEQKDVTEITEVRISEGYYTIASLLNTSFVLDIYGGRATDGTNADLYKSNNSPAQVFKITPVTVDDKIRYTIRPVSSMAMGLAVNVASMEGRAQTNVLQKTASDTADAQLWYFSKGSNGGYRIHNQLSDQHTMQVYGGAAQNKANVHIYKINNKIEQEWKLTKVGGGSVDEGLYTIRYKTQTGKVLDIYGNKLTNNANVQIYKSNGSAAQKFWVEKANEKYRRIRGYASGMSMDVSNASYQNGTNIQLYKTKNATAQKFILEDTGAKVGDLAVIFIKTVKDRYYVEASGSNVQLGSSGGYWLFEKTSETQLLPDGLYTIRTALKDTMALDIYGGSLKAGGKADIYSWNDTNAQKFQVRYRSGKTTLMALQSGMYLTNTGGTVKNTNRITQQNSSGTEARWKLVPTGDGTGSYYIRYAANQNYGMDVYGGRTANKTAVQLYAANGSTAQSFYFIKADIKRGWQNYLGAYRYVYNTLGYYFTDPEIKEIKSGGDGLGDKVTWIGDSYTTGAAKEIFSQLPGVDIDAQNGRAFAEDRGSIQRGLDILKMIKKNGELREILVFALGTNDMNLGLTDAEQVVTLAGKNAKIIFVTANNKSSSHEYTKINTTIRTIVAKYSNVYLADWETYSSGKMSQYFSDNDPLHPSLGTGFKDWATLIVNAVKQAEQGTSGQNTGEQNTGSQNDDWWNTDQWNTGGWNMG